MKKLVSQDGLTEVQAKRKRHGVIDRVQVTCNATLLRHALLLAYEQASDTGSQADFMELYNMIRGVNK